jgi:hypothetical protein
VACIGVVVAAVSSATWSSAEAPLPSLPSSSAPSSRAAPTLADPTARASRHEPSNTCSLLVSISDPEGRPFAKPWRLALRSARHASLDLAFEADSDRVQVELDHGRWTFEPSAAELAARSIELDVDATTNGANLRFLHATQVFGSVLDDRGDPVTGLPLSLRGLDGQLATRATSDGAGTFQFPSIPVGAYELSAGREESPLRPTRVVELGAGKQVLEPLRTAALSEYRLRIVTEDGRPVAGATVEGTGRNGGGFSGSTAASLAGIDLYSATVV